MATDDDDDLAQRERASPMLQFHSMGDWKEGEIVVKWSDRNTRRIVPEIEARIDAEWDEVASRPGVHLFDGPMCRLDLWSVNESFLRLHLSLTSYKAFLGTNLANPQWSKEHGRDVMANPIGVSALVETSDGMLLLGRRNESVAYYPNRVHPFAGALEPDDGTNPYDAVRRELSEELRLSVNDIASVRCRALAEDLTLRQPELLFQVRTTLTARQLEAQLDRAEHCGTYRVQGKIKSVETAIEDRELTPVARGTILLWGKEKFGYEWFIASA